MYFEKPSLSLWKEWPLDMRISLVFSLFTAHILMATFLHQIWQYFFK